MNIKSSSGKKEVIIVAVVVIGLLMLMHGNEIGDFQNSDRADKLLWPLLYTISLVALLILIRLRKNTPLKYKILLVFCLMICAFLPMYLLTGLSKYIDYYNSDKQWKLTKMTITHKSSSSQRYSTVYYYTFQIGDTALDFSSKLDYPVGQVLYLQLCTTKLGMIVANKFYE